MPWESRFQVCDPVCGLVDVYPSKSGAMAGARKNAKECNHVTVNDDGEARGCQQLERTRRNDWFQAVGDQPVKARFGTLGRTMSPSKPRPTELQLRAESRVRIEPYTKRHTIFVMSDVSAARELRDIARRQVSSSKSCTRMLWANSSTGHDGANRRRLAHCRPSPQFPRHSSL